mmetsp:Transcript_747/g.1813  ORF Transcript_747/g.1813 Transcript_747/m.1813 type:complete len:4405 (+) Transcript_747:307-13521(+)|eukprot:CAMPEP_0172360114 /NCGR_PEP_ID=MMETSP1060-20121228/4201_1 /TAXON_ID=37318 /ORGANISM="Pseudo-nitzschia pungens, Strain cf. cingulata" /LENGTH=4404 /DNA_ID=CAMNT_0013082011 /DNA_START=243 /DNA_END=13457 /DNA_ORIENTATION=-
MAPIFPSIGITPQIIDDERLKSLKSDLESIIFSRPTTNVTRILGEINVPLDIERLVGLLEPWQSWTFEEQVDLQEWVEPLNRIDASLSFYIQKYPFLLLLSPVERTKSKGASKTPKTSLSQPAKSIEEVNSVSDTVRKNILIILKFLSGLLTNSSNKSVFNSVEELVDLLAAADDSIASSSLETLCALAMPPSLHKQQVPEIQTHSTALHTSKTTSHKRLTALARGWGTRGSGLGLYACAVSDDSTFGQGALPQQAGELNFTFFRTATSEKNRSEEDIDESSLVHINLPANSFVEDSEMAFEATSKNSDESDDSTGSKQKRRRVALATKVEKTIRSTADLFFQCLRQAGGVEKIPADRLFPLLADIRLTRSFYSRLTRVSAIERRLRALITILHANPSQEVMAGYFQAQPELCVELVDLLRPTVSSGAVSASSSSPTSGKYFAHNRDNISTLSNSPIVPYEVRELALQSLTALAARREGSNGSLTGFARHSNIVSELGVGKGQYLGLLPTLIRYSLASLGSLVASTASCDEFNEEFVTLNEKSEEDTVTMDIGLAFIEATSAPMMPRFEQLEKALVFMDSVLTLTSAIVSTPSGTSSLTECGLVPALLNTVSIDAEEVSARIMPESASAFEIFRIRSLLRFVTAQAVQILEGAIVTHNNALSAFHNLNGVEVLTTRLSKEILSARDTRIKNSSDNDCTQMEIDTEAEPTPSAELRASQRVLLYGVVTCLTVVFHQESTSSSVATPSGTAEVQKPELTEALIEILDNVDLYGGHLASLISTLLSDVMNSDPHVVKYVHESGLARSFLKMLGDGPSGDPISPPVPELIMSIPTVLAALALTEAGAKKLEENNPFPGLLKLFHHPKYAMPNSRCMLNEMTSIVGTGLDEIMRHVPSLSKPICKAISDAMMEVVAFGDQVVLKESDEASSCGQGPIALDVDHDRTCLIQYGLNFGQILEQILHNEEHCEPFFESGGLDAILKMYPFLMPTSDRFLAHISCLSCPSLSTITHSSTEETLTLAFKCIALRCDPLKVIRKTLEVTNDNLNLLKSTQRQMRLAFPSEKYNSEDDFDACFILDGLPRLSICDITDASFNSKKALLARYLRAAVTVQWLAGLLSAVIQASCQRSADGPASAWNEREWKKEFPSKSFRVAFASISRYFQSATLEACRIRSEEDFEERELKRQKGYGSDHVRYKLRIVCSEGAVVRDGIEIDSCASVGSMEMGEIVESFDRCVNSSGVLRYRTQRGWLSEQTRGHGREPIAEVLAVWKSEIDDNIDDNNDKQKRSVNERTEDGIPDIRNSGANVLARIQTVYVELYSSLLRLAQQSLPSLSGRPISFQEGATGWHVSTLMKMLSSGISKGFEKLEVCQRIWKSPEHSCKINKLGIALYLGSLLNHLQTCLFEEKRDKHTLNLPLLISLANENFDLSDQVSEESDRTKTNFFHGMQFIFELCLADFHARASITVAGETNNNTPMQSLDRTTASFLPSVTSLLRRLISSQSNAPSQTIALLEKLKEHDVISLVGGIHQDTKSDSENKGNANFSSQEFFQRLLCKSSDIILKPWSDSRFVDAPPHVVHPLTTLVLDTIIALEDSNRKALSTHVSGNGRETASMNISLRDTLARFRRTGSNVEQFAAAMNSVVASDDFQPSEEVISCLMEMGFSRDHAWDAIDRTRSNSLEVAMEYALSHPTPSAESIERRRAERERRRRQRRGGVGESVQDSSRTNDESQPSAGNNDANVIARAMEVDQAASSGNVIARAMEVDQGTSSDKAKDETDHPRDASIEMLVSRVESWKAESTRVAYNFLLKKSVGTNNEKGSDGESEAVTTILSSFLLDLCQRYPEDRDNIAENLFCHLRKQMEEKKEGETVFWTVIPGRESSMTSLCHSAVLFIRAMPKTRPLMLKRGLVTPIISVIATYLDQSNSTNQTKRTKWPTWLPSALLMLDIMAQPIVAFSANNSSDDPNQPDDSNFNEEYYEVKKDHEKQTRDLSILAHQLFSALSNRSESEGKSSKPRKTVQSTQNYSDGTDILPTSSDDKELHSNLTENEMVFKSLPPYFPLVPSQLVETCANICLSIIGDESVSPPPGVTHATLLLLMRMLRSPKVSTYCLKAGAGQKILNLGRRCRFNGHSGLVALIFRRLLEDEINLQAVMETEIRNAMMKLDAKKENITPGSKDAISVPRKSFVKAVTPVLCRDPVCFVKAMAVSVVFENPRSGSDGRVIMLNSTQRSKYLDIVSEVLKLKPTQTPNGKAPTSRRSSSGKLKRLSNASSGTRSKTPSRSNKRNQTKRCKKEKGESKENCDEEIPRHSTNHASPIHHITGLLLNRVIQLGVTSVCEKNDLAEAQNDTFDFGFESSFLWTANLLEILADLVLAMPNCATAIHKFKPSRKNRGSVFASFNNALQGCPSPPRTFVSFLLHGLLSQDRWNRKSSRVLSESVNSQSAFDKQMEMIGYLRTKVARSTARLLVALVARPGEGRRRVIIELVFALSGGQLGLSSASSFRPAECPLHPRPSELHALQSWGELCIGFAAPKSNGSSYDSNSSLSYEVIKIMLENGMAHALLVAVHRVPLYHPMASSALGVLILPFEILTRASVANSVKSIVEKEARSRENKENPKSNKQHASKEKNSDNSHRRDSFVADDHMLEDAFAADVTRGQRSPNESFDDEIVVDGDVMVDVDGDEDDDGMDIDNENDAEESDDDMSSGSDSDGSSDVDDSDDDGSDDSDSEDDSDDSANDEESILDDMGESEDTYGNGVFEDHPFDFEPVVNALEEEENEFEALADGGRDRIENQVEEGWTRIDSSGLNGMVLGGRRTIGQHLNGSATIRTNRGFIDAAEAMIGTLLRTGEIRSEALAEIEGTLGIQIMPSNERNNGTVSGRRPFGSLMSRHSRTDGNGSSTGSRELVGAIPQINQRSQPDLGYSAMGRGSRWSEINPMEYVFGGPCITAGSRHYDLVSPVIEPDENDSFSRMSGDTQLFPGGPAAATHARTQHSLHPLLGDVELPPINALVSGLESHDVRASRSIQPTTRRLSELTGPSFNSGGFFVSSSTGTIVRSNRVVSNPRHRSPQGSPGSSGWTDHDGLPFDATVEEFSSAFENGLVGTIIASSSTSRLLSAVADNERRSDPDRNEERPLVETGTQLEDAENEPYSPSQEGDVAMEEGSSNEVGAVEGNQNQAEDEQDGDGVASSLAVGLRLSPPSLEHEDQGSNDNHGSNVSLTNAGGQSSENGARNEEEQQGENGTINDDSLGEDGEQETAIGGSVREPNQNGLVCPPGIDPEVFNALPLEMQQEVISQERETSNLADQLDAGSSLDPEVLAALPEDMRREAIQQEQQERRLREQAPADPSNAAEMDNASFIASLAPELRNDILLTADESVIRSLPPNIVAEAQILRERRARAEAQAQASRRIYAEQPAQVNQRGGANGNNVVGRSSAHSGSGREQASSRRKQHTGKIRVELDKKDIAFMPSRGPVSLSTIVAKSDLKALIRFMYLLSPVRPHKILQKVFQNISMNGNLRSILSSTFLNLLNDKKSGALFALDTTSNLYKGPDDWRKKMDGLFEGSLQDFPPTLLIGAAPEVLENDGLNPNIVLIRRRQTSDTAASIAANLPISSRGSGNEQFLPPVVSTRMVDTLLQMCKSSQRFCLDLLVKRMIVDTTTDPSKIPTGFESLLDLLEKPRYSKSSTNLEQLLNLLEIVVSPLSHIPKLGEDSIEVSQKDVDEASSQGKEWVDVPRVIVSQERLQLICSILKMEICRDTAFAKVSTIARRLCRVDANRGYVLTELASVARALGVDATRDLTALNIRISATVDKKQQDHPPEAGKNGSEKSSVGRGASTSVAVSTSTSELKLLRVLQTLQSLCMETSVASSKRNEGVIVTEELVQLLEAMNLDSLWSELTSCLRVVQVLEGVNIEGDTENGVTENNADEVSDEIEMGGKKKLENSVAGLLTRFLPSIEAFFVANGCFTKNCRIDAEDQDSTNETYTTNLVGGKKLFDFVEANKVLLNALVRNNSSLLEKGLKTLIQLPKCRMLLDFDVKRHWFKLQVRRLRQQANRRYGSIRLQIRRDYVFEDAYLQLSPRNAEEMRGRLHITFRNEQGVDAGGLSREFYGILAKEIFNPNYALFTSTEDGCTFQPNPNSSVNPDHLSYFRFVGRIVGKAVADGYLLDSHFTRSLYKHMLGKEPTHHDMEAIDPDYYKNLRTILEYNLGDLCLDLTFSVEDHSFGRNQVVDLIPNGRNIPVTEDNKARYVSLVCKNRMTTAISSQIKAFLDGFHELVSKDLIQIFTPRELELLISGLPDIDIHDLKKNTDYNGWKATDRQIEWFWNVLFSLSRNEKASFLQFVTGSSKVPLAGFGELPGMRGVQKFSIHKAGGSAGSLMSAHTCFNSLDLPVYKSEQELREKLIYAINEGAVGFLMA